MNKKFFTISFFAMALTLFLSSCNNPNNITGEGPLVSQSFQVDDFTSLDIYGPFVVVWNESPQTSVEVSMQENLYEFFSIETQNGVLTQRFSRGLNNISRDNTPRLYINSPSLTGITISGSVYFLGESLINANDFSINTSGSGSVDLELNVVNLDVSASGSSDIFLSGTASNTHIYSSGSSDINAFDLYSTDVVIRSSGSSDVFVHAINTLYASVSGSSDVSFTGNPTVTANTSGSGTVTIADIS